MKFVQTVVALLAILVLEAFAEHRNSTRSLADDETQENSRLGGSLCPHKDYRSYVKCLQTHRRHDHTPQATSKGTASGGPNCMEECERESCRHQGAGPCAEVCYDRCLKKTKEIHHRITEYETACGEGEDCSNGGKFGPGRGTPAIANLTTSIDIRNYVNNTNVIVHNSKVDEDERGNRDRGDRRGDENRDHGGRNVTCEGGPDGCKDAGDKGHGGSEPPRGLPPGFQPWYPAPSLTLIPQIQMVPQVTFGLGIAPGGGFGAVGPGCPYTSIWLCLPQQQHQVRDCSGCVQPYPYSRGRCDPQC